MMNIQKIVSLIKRGNEEEKRQIRNRVKLAKKELERLKRDFLEIDKDMERMICFGSLERNNIESIKFDIDNELRAFRHVFRFIYQSELDINKLQDLSKKIPGIMKEFKKYHHVFIHNIQKILEFL
jgi:seryl-tRNA synthetase